MNVSFAGPAVPATAMPSSTEALSVPPISTLPRNSDSVGKYTGSVPSTSMSIDTSTALPRSPSRSVSRIRLLSLVLPIRAVSFRTRPKLPSRARSPSMMRPPTNAPPSGSPRPIEKAMSWAAAFRCPWMPVSLKIHTCDGSARSRPNESLRSRLPCVRRSAPPDSSKPSVGSAKPMGSDSEKSGLNVRSKRRMFVAPSRTRARSSRFDDCGMLKISFSFCSSTWTVPSGFSPT